MILIERNTNLPMDIVILINNFIISEILIDENFKDAIDLWFENQKDCQFRYGHISLWNTSNITNMMWIFYNRKDFNEDISQWNVKNVRT